MKIYCEKNEFFSNYLRVQKVVKHLPYLFEFFTDETFQPAKALQADIVFFQSPILAKNFPAGPKYVWDLDDVLESEEATDVGSPEVIAQVMRMAFDKCEGVIFGNALLREHYKEWYVGDYIIMDDFIDPCTHQAKNKKGDRLHIGYIGTDYYYPEVAKILPVVEKLREKYDFDFSVVGVSNAEKLLKEKGFGYVPYNNDYDRFNEYLAEQGFDIGIVWYNDDKEINMAKTHLKFSEWSWLAVPTVCSRFVTGDYATEDVTRLVDNTDGLYSALEKLIQVEEYRVAMGKLAKAFVEKRFSLHTKKLRHIAFFEQLVNKPIC